MACFFPNECRQFTDRITRTGLCCAPGHGVSWINCRARSSSAWLGGPSTRSWAETAVQAVTKHRLTNNPQTSFVARADEFIIGGSPCPVTLAHRPVLHQSFGFQHTRPPTRIGTTVGCHFAISQSTCQLSDGEDVDWTGEDWPNQTNQVLEAREAAGIHVFRLSVE